MHLCQFSADACGAGEVPLVGAAVAQAAVERRCPRGSVDRPAAARSTGAGGPLAGRRARFPVRAIFDPRRGEDRHRVRFPSLSVFFPAYNDAPSLPGLLARTFAVLEEHVGDYEVIVVNDGSQDRTAEVLEELRARYHPWLRVVTHEANRG